MISGLADVGLEHAPHHQGLKPGQGAGVAREPFLPLSTAAEGGERWSSDDFRDWELPIWHTRVRKN